MTDHCITHPIPWTNRIKYHPIFDDDQTTHVFQDQSLPDLTYSRFSTSEHQPFDPLLHASHVPRNLMAVVGNILAIIVNGELRIVSLLAIKHALENNLAHTTFDQIKSLFHTHAPFYRVQFGPSTDSSSLNAFTSSWIELQFNQSSRFLAIISATRILVVDFNTLLHRVADLHLHSNTPIPNALDTATKTIYANLLELGCADLSLGASTNQIIQCLWHPSAKEWTDLLVLTSKGEVRVYSILVTIDYPLHTYLILNDHLAQLRSSPMYIGDVQCAVPTAFCLGLPLTSMLVNRVVKPTEKCLITQLRPELVYLGVTAFVAMSDGSIKTICPVLPLLWSISLYDYKCMRASLSTLSLSYPPVPDVSIRALARFLTHIDQQVPAEFRIRPINNVTNEKRFSDLTTSPLSAEELVYEESDLTTTFIIEAPEYPGMTSSPLPLVLAPNAQPTMSMLDPVAKCSDVKLVLGEPAHSAALQKPIQVPVLVVAYESGQMDVLVLDTVWPSWGTRLALNPTNTFVSTPSVLEYVVPGAVHSISSFATETIQVLDVQEDQCAMIRIMYDPIVSGQILVSHIEGVHQIVIRLGLPSILQHVVNMAPLTIMDTKLTDQSYVRVVSGDTFDREIDQILLDGNSCVGCVALGDPMLDHAVVLVTQSGDAVASQLYTLNLDTVEEVEKETLKANARQVLDLISTYTSTMHSVSANMHDIVDSYPTVCKLNLPESKDGGVHEKQIEYIDLVTTKIGEGMKPLSNLADMLKLAMQGMSESLNRADTLVQIITFDDSASTCRVTQLEESVRASAHRAKGILQVIYDLRNPARLSVAERQFKRDVVRAMYEARMLSDRVSKIRVMKDAFIKWAQADKELVGQEQWTDAIVSADQQGLLERLLNAQYEQLVVLEGKVLMLSPLIGLEREVSALEL